MFITYAAISAESYEFQIVNTKMYRREMCNITPSVRCFNVTITSVTNNNKHDSRILTLSSGDSESNLVETVNRNIKVTAWCSDRHFMLRRFTEDMRIDEEKTNGNQLIAYTPETLEGKGNENKSIGEIVFPWTSEFGVPLFGPYETYTICIIASM